MTDWLTFIVYLTSHGNPCVAGAEYVYAYRWFEWSKYIVQTNRVFMNKVWMVQHEHTMSIIVDGRCL